MSSQQQRTIEEQLQTTISKTKRIHQLIRVADFFSIDFDEVYKRVDNLNRLLLYVLSITNSSSVYKTPLNSIIPQLSKNLTYTHRFVLARSSGFLMITNFKTRTVLDILDDSNADLNWFIELFRYSSRTDQASIINVVVVPPISVKTPNLFLIWFFISIIQMGSLSNGIKAAKQLASLTFGNNLNKRIVIEEGGISPLLKLLKVRHSFDARIASLFLLSDLAMEKNAVKQIVGGEGIPLILQALSSSSIEVQVQAAKLISIMADENSVVQEKFGRENAIKTIVSLLSIVNKNDSISNMKISCSKALWMLLRESKSNCNRLMEGNGLVQLARLIESGKEELKHNCLMSIMEMANIVEFDFHFRVAFKANYNAFEVLHQLLRVIDSNESSKLQIIAIKSVGSLAKIFTLKEIGVINLLLRQLSKNNQEISTEIVIALGKFVCLENYLSAQYSKAIVDFNGVPSLMTLLNDNENSMLEVLILLCYLASQHECRDALLKENALNALQVASRSSILKNPLLIKLIAEAIDNLRFYQSRNQVNLQS